MVITVRAKCTELLYLELYRWFERWYDVRDAVLCQVCPLKFSFQVLAYTDENYNNTGNERPLLEVAHQEWYHLMSKLF